MRIVKLYLSLIFIAVFLSGCATTKTMDQVGARSIQNKKLAIITGERPKFIIKTPAKSFLASQGLIGFFAVHALSEDLAQTYNIPDPALAISQKLKSRLSSRHKMHVVPKGSYAQYELTVTSTAFGAAHGPMQFSKYSANYAASAQLRDLRNNSIVAEASCMQVGIKDPEKAPTHEQLFANQAAILKAELNSRVEICTNNIIKKIFGKTK